jgi:hypothetical protein
MLQNPTLRSNHMIQHCFQQLRRYELKETQALEAARRFALLIREWVSKDHSA